MQPESIHEITHGGGNRGRRSDLEDRMQSHMSFPSTSRNFQEGQRIPTLAKHKSGRRAGKRDSG